MKILASRRDSGMTDGTLTSNYYVEVNPFIYFIDSEEVEQID